MAPSGYGGISRQLVLQAIAQRARSKAAVALLIVFN